MKSLFIFSILFFSVLLVKAQSIPSLSPGKYETKSKVSPNKWVKGDLILLEGNKYRLSSSDEVGEYRFSVAAQRIFFISGLLKGAYTKVMTNNNKPTIVFPAEQNVDLGITTEVWASKQ